MKSDEWRSQIGCTCTKNRLIYVCFKVEGKVQFGLTFCLGYFVAQECDQFSLCIHSRENYRFNGPVEYKLDGKEVEAWSLPEEIKRCH